MKLLIKFSGLIFFVIALIVMMSFGKTIGYAFMIIWVVLLVGANIVLRELTKNEGDKSRAEIEKALAGSTMYDFLQRNPDRLLALQRAAQGTQNAVLKALDADDARRVKELLAKNSESE
jgi:ABC-type uncharacterized transport system YnjBCD ATPase subunit